MESSVIPFIEKLGGWIETSEVVGRCVVKNLGEPELREFVQRYKPRSFSIDCDQLHSIMLNRNYTNQDLIWLFMWFDRCANGFIDVWLPEYDFRCENGGDSDFCNLYLFYTTVKSSHLKSIDKLYCFSADETWTNAMKNKPSLETVKLTY
jgi:hypothetical protein